MALKIEVKAGNISNLSDARYCAGMGVEMLGFNIDTHFEDSVSPELFKAITGWVSGPQIVGEIASSFLPDWKEFDINCLQVTDADLLPEIKEAGLDVILSIDFKDIDYNMTETLLEKHKSVVKYYLLAGSEYSDLTNKDKSKISEWSKLYPVMLGFGIKKDNLKSILDSGVKAISIYGSNEIRPGYKSYDEIADILEELES